MKFKERIFWMLIGAAAIVVVALPLAFWALRPLREPFIVHAREEIAAILAGDRRTTTPATGPPTVATAPDVTVPRPVSTGAPPTVTGERLTDETPPIKDIRFPLVFRQRPTATFTPTPTKTRRPTATPTPTLPWPEPLERPGSSKLGLHVQWNNSPEIMEFIRRMKPVVVKAVGDYGFLDEVKKVSPSTVIVARTVDQYPLEGDPVASARAFVAMNLETYRQHPAVDYWEGPNEPAVHGRMAWYAIFEAERVRAMAEHGLRAAIGTFSAGVPEWDEFAAFLPAVEVARKYEGILALHEYDAPTLDRSFGAGLPGHPNYPDRGALTLRYRWWYEDYLKPRGLAISLVISEAGVDGGIGNRPAPRGRGWQDFADYWVDMGLADSGIRAYLQQLARYDAELQRDDYVIGCALFTAGAIGDNWKSYDITPILRHIATYIIAPSARPR